MQVGLFARAVAGAAEGFAGFDTIFKRRLRKVVPRFQALIDDPAGYLSVEDVNIGPGNRYFTGTVLGLLIGLNLSCGAVESVFGFDNAFRDGPLERQVAIWLLVIAGTVLSIATLLYWMRGGCVVLQKEHVEFRFRNDVVVCPWELFNADGKPEWLDTATLVMTINPKAVRGVLLLVNGSLVETARLVKTKQFRFRPDGTRRITNHHGYPEIALRDLYRARLNEIGSLLLILSRELGAPRNQQRASDDASPSSGV